MRLTYETGIATLVQFMTIGLLNIANGVNSVATVCRHDSNDCIENLLVSLIFFMLITGWFGFVCLLGYLAQERRSKYFAVALIGAELMIAAVAYHNATHYTDILGLTTSLIDIAFAVWIIWLAARLALSKGKRITRSRPRQRRRPSSSSAQ